MLIHWPVPFCLALHVYDLEGLPTDPPAMICVPRSDSNVHELEIRAGPEQSRNPSESFAVDELWWAVDVHIRLNFGLNDDIGKFDHEGKNLYLLE